MANHKTINTHFEAQLGASDDQPCHFMRLPTELRLAIYDFAFHNALQNLPLATLYVPGRRALSGQQLHPLLKGLLAVLHTSRSLRDESITVYCRSASALLESRRLDCEQSMGVILTLPVGATYLLMAEVYVDRRAMFTEMRHVCALMQEAQEGQSNANRVSFAKRARVHRSGIMLCWPETESAR